MQTIEEVCQEIESLWEEHRAIRYPRECYAFEPQFHGTSLVLLDAGIAGCVSTFIHRGYTLDLWRTAGLGGSYRDAALILPYMPEESRTYFARLERLAGLILQVVARKARAIEEA